ncbi:nucleotidyltransferase family protein [Propionivibrio sp.]|uniref:nucleotidyltransferase family protein n=1 Tax=Propionivibrio sp. TaxID=2212460 RepID=UPI003BF0D72A
MRPSELLNLHREAIRGIVAAHRGLNPRVFGSVAKGKDTEESDLDILVDCAPRMSLFDIGAIRVELLQLLGNIPLDVVTPQALPDKWRDKVISEAKPI